MSQEMNLWTRLQGNSPKFFKIVTNIAISLAAGAGAILAAPTLIDGLVIPDSLNYICQWLVAAGMAGAAVAKTTVDDNSNKS